MPTGECKMTKQSDRPSLRYLAEIMYDSDSAEEAARDYLKTSSVEDPDGRLLKGEIEELLQQNLDVVQLALAIADYGDYGDKARAAIQQYPDDYAPLLRRILLYIDTAQPSDPKVVD